MKIIEEYHDDHDISEALGSYIDDLRKAINDESATIALYESILKRSLPAEDKEIINEILDDEKDHLVLITELLNDALHQKFPEYGDSEDSSITIEEIVDEVDESESK